MCVNGMVCVVMETVSVVCLCGDGDCVSVVWFVWWWRLMCVNGMVCVVMEMDVFEWYVLCGDGD